MALINATRLVRPRNHLPAAGVNAIGHQHQVADGRRVDGVLNVHGAVAQLV